MDAFDTAILNGLRDEKSKDHLCGVAFDWAYYVATQDFW